MDFNFRNNHSNIQYIGEFTSSCICSYMTILLILNNTCTCTVLALFLFRTIDVTSSFFGVFKLWMFMLLFPLDSCRNIPGRKLLCEYMGRVLYTENQLWQNKGAYLSHSEPIEASNNTPEPQQTMELTPYYESFLYLFFPVSRILLL